jgi:putative transposase
MGVLYYLAEMARKSRVSLGGYAYHVLNRANRRARLFDGDDDYAAFEAVLEEAHRRVPVRICAYCVMPNHWHLVLWPEEDDQIAPFMQWLTLTHAQRWNGFRDLTGTGHVYQGRYKSFPIQQDDHFLAVCQYVESNPVRAGLVVEATAWRWGSAWRRAAGSSAARALLAAWPTDPPPDWDHRAGVAPDSATLGRIALSLRQDRPFGDAAWVERISAGSRV